MKEPEFDAAYRAAKRPAFGQAIARLQQGTSAAATTLLKTMIEPNTPASVRVRAAECVLNQAMKAIEMQDIEARLSELERAAEVSKTGGTPRVRLKNTSESEKMQWAYSGVCPSATQEQGA